VNRKEIYYSLPYSPRRMLYSIYKPKWFRENQHKRTIDTSSGYSYKPFDQNRSIFVHIPKAAGVSICRSLFGNLAGGHATVSEYQMIFSKKEFDRYFKFTFVRNPWDRVFSAYNFLKKGGMNERDRKWAEAELAPYRDFNDFVRKGLGKPSVQRWVHFVPQTSFLFVPGSQKLQVDFLGFFENIQEDFQYVANILGMGESAVMKKDNVTSSDRKLGYKDSYTEEARDIVARIYERDIENFGYNFDNSSLPSQLESRLVRTASCHR